MAASIEAGRRHGFPGQREKLPHTPAPPRLGGDPRLWVRRAGRDDTDQTRFELQENGELLREGWGCRGVDTKSEGAPDMSMSSEHLVL